MPAGPVVGVKLETTGMTCTVKFVELLTVPPGVVTEIAPVVAPTGTAAVICVAEPTVYDVALVPLATRATRCRTVAG